jgi:hypothetical protein
MRKGSHGNGEGSDLKVLAHEILLVVSIEKIDTDTLLRSRLHEFLAG